MDFTTMQRRIKRNIGDDPNLLELRPRVVPLPNPLATRLQIVEILIYIGAVANYFGLNLDAIMEQGLLQGKRVPDKEKPVFVRDDEGHSWYYSDGAIRMVLVELEGSIPYAENGYPCASLEDGIKYLNENGYISGYDDDSRPVHSPSQGS